MGVHGDLHAIKEANSAANPQEASVSTSYAQQGWKSGDRMTARSHGEEGERDRERGKGRGVPGGNEKIGVDRGSGVRYFKVENEQESNQM